MSTPYISHVIRAEEKVFTTSGEPVDIVIQVLSTTDNSRRVIAVIFEDESEFYPSFEEQDFLFSFYIILSRFRKFKFSILTFDKPYPVDVITYCLSQFLGDKEITQEQIDILKNHE